MKLAVISDIHGNIAALEAVMDDIARKGVERIVNLGDCLSGPFDAVATVERLMTLDLPTVRGNHDRQLYDRPRDKMGRWEDWVIDDLAERHLDWVRALPPAVELEGVLLCHGTPASDDENWLDYRAESNRLVARDLPGVIERAGDAPQGLILCGHTHSPRTVRLPDGRMVVNPGSVGCPAYLDTRVEPAFVHQTGSPDARYAVVELRRDGWSVDLCSVPYDASEMARIALSKGADSFAQAVSTGWFA